MKDHFAPLAHPPIAIRFHLGLFDDDGKPFHKSLGNLLPCPAIDAGKSRSRHPHPFCRFQMAKSLVITKAECLIFLYEQDHHPLSIFQWNAIRRKIRDRRYIGYVTFRFGAPSHCCFHHFHGAHFYFFYSFRAYGGTKNRGGTPQIYEQMFVRKNIFAVLTLHSSSIFAHKKSVDAVLATTPTPYYSGFDPRINAPASSCHSPSKPQC